MSSELSLAVGSRLSSGSMYQPSPQFHGRKNIESQSGVSPFIHFDSARLNRRKLVQEQDRKNDTPARAIAFGLINGGVMIPTMVGFASIIYKDQFFTDDEHNYLPQAIKLTFLSSAIHQLCFLALSSLPFAVGQVQDAGLIFLSAIAASIVSNMGKDADPDQVMSTTVVSLSLLTVVLGLLLIITGKLKLARLIQYLPLPVVGGYLAFIGLFCGLSGLRLTTGERVDGLGGITDVFNSRALKLMIPGVISTCMLFLISKRAKENRYVLPAFMLSMPIIFYIAMLISGNSLEDAREAGWVAKKTKVPQFYDVFQLFDFKNVDWSAAFPSSIPTFFAMFAVVAFGSSLDVAAIQFELGKPLDYDHELVTVGWSNLISGGLGGYTGSYIFSQTIFTLRNGIQSRWAGFSMAMVEFFLFLIPLDLLSVLPRFFFGSVLLFVSIDLLLEWLLHSYFALELNEYVLVWLTFIFINIWGLEIGMSLGVVCSALHFVYSYSMNNTNVVYVPKPISKAVRNPIDRKILNKYSKRIVALQLNGYQFFGTVIGTIVAVQSHVVVPEAGMDDDHHHDEETSSHSRRSDRMFDDSPLSMVSSGNGYNNGNGNNNQNIMSSNTLNVVNRPVRAFSEANEKMARKNRGGRISRSGSNDNDDNMSGGAATTPSPKRNNKKKKLGRLSEQQQQQQQMNNKKKRNSVGKRESDNEKKSKKQTGTNQQKEKGKGEEEEEDLVETKFVVLDMRMVTAIDATAARACFLTILQSLNVYEIRLIFSGLTDQMKSILEVNGVLKRQRMSEGNQNRRSSSEDADFDYSDLESFMTNDDDHHALSFDTWDDALQFCEEAILNAAIQKSSSDMSHKHSFFNTDALQVVKAKYFVQKPVKRDERIFAKGSPANCIYVVDNGRIDLIDRVRSFSGGSIFGVGDYFGESQVYSYTAVAARPSVLLCLTRSAFSMMQEEDPDLAVQFQTALIKTMTNLTVP